MSTSKIEWTDASWNPITGCTKISSGCQHCYAEVMARRLCAMRVDKYKNGLFIELKPNLVGMAEYQEGLQYGEQVKVYVKKIINSKKKIKLVIV